MGKSSPSDVPLFFFTLPTRDIQTCKLHVCLHYLRYITAAMIERPPLLAIDTVETPDRGE